MKFSIHFDSLAEMQDALNKLGSNESKAKPEATKAKPKPKRKAKAKAKAEPVADGAEVAEPTAPTAPTAEVTPACKESKPEQQHDDNEFEHAELADALYVGMTRAIPGKRKDKTTAIAVIKEGSSDKGDWVLFYRLGVNKRGVYLWSMKCFNGKMKFLSPDEITDRMGATEDNAAALVELQDE